MPSSPPDRRTGADVVVVGAGVVGLAAAWRLATAGVDVAVLDAVGPGGGASSRNAGLIDAPGWGRRPSLDATLKMGSLALYERLADEGPPFGLVRTGRLSLIATEAERAVAHDEAGRTDAAEVLDAAAVRRLEPAVGSAVLGALWTPDAAHAEPADTCRALAVAAGRAGARLVAPATVTGFDGRPDGGARLSLAEGGHVDAEAVLLATGAWAGRIAVMLDESLAVPVVPVAGQMWATAPLAPGTLRTTITAMESALAWADGLPALTHDEAGRRRTRHLYGRQRPNGEVVFGGDRVRLRRAGAGVGSAGGTGPADPTDPADPTVDPRHDPIVDDDGIAVNHAQAASLLPFLAGTPPVRTWSGVMPFTDDGLPLIGAVTGVPGLFVAGGLASSGFNRGPMTGWLAADLMLGRDVPPEVATARPGRRHRRVDGR